MVLRHLDDLSERETAEVLGVSIGTVKSQTRQLSPDCAPELLDLTGGPHE